MDRNEIIKITENVQNKSNKTLFESKKLLEDEFEKTKQLIADLTYHLEAIEEYHTIINNEITKRKNN
jgi:uncharacterized protein YaaN involved in tellurite resistance